MKDIAYFDHKFGNVYVVTGAKTRKDARKVAEREARKEYEYLKDEEEIRQAMDENISEAESVYQIKAL